MPRGRKKADAQGQVDGAKKVQKKLDFSASPRARSKSSSSSSQEEVVSDSQPQLTPEERQVPSSPIDTPRSLRSRKPSVLMISNLLSEDHQDTDDEADKTDDEEEYSEPKEPQMKDDDKEDQNLPPPVEEIEEITLIVDSTQQPLTGKKRGRPRKGEERPKTPIPKRRKISAEEGEEDVLVSPKKKTPKVKNSGTPKASKCVSKKKPAEKPVPLVEKKWILSETSLNGLVCPPINQDHVGSNVSMEEIDIEITNEGGVSGSQDVKLKCFETAEVRSPVTVIEKDIRISSSRLMSAGGSVRSVDWLEIKCDSPSSERTVNQLLVAAHNHPGERHQLGSHQFEGRNSLQVWMFAQKPQSQETEIQPKRVYLIPHNHGCCFEAKWLHHIDYSSSSNDPDSPSHVSSKPQKTNGIFSAVLGDGNIHLYQLPELPIEDSSTNDLSQPLITSLSLSPFATLSMEGKYFLKSEWLIRSNVVSMAGASFEGTIAVWNVCTTNLPGSKEKLKPIMSFKGHDFRIRGLSWRSENPHTIMCVGDDPQIRFWDLREPFEGSTMTMTGYGLQTHCIWVSGVPKSFCCSDGGNLEVFSLHDGTFRKLKFHSTAIWESKFASSIGSLISVGSDGKACLFQLRSLEKRKGTPVTLLHHTSITQKDASDSKLTFKVNASPLYQEKVDAKESGLKIMHDPLLSANTCHWSDSAGLLAIGTSYGLIRLFKIDSLL